MKYRPHFPKNGTTNLPQDDTFSWISSYDANIAEWKPLLSEEFSAWEKTKPKDYLKEHTLRVINYLLINLKDFNLPQSPRKFFNSEIRISFDDYVAHRGIKPSANSQSGYRETCRIMANIASNDSLSLHRIDSVSPLIPLPDKLPIGSKHPPALIIKRGQIPLDPHFEWLQEFDSELSEWRELLAPTFDSYRQTLANNSFTKSLKGVNHVLRHIENFSLPKSPEGFFTSEIDLHYSHFCEVLGFKLSKDSRLTYNLTVQAFDDAYIEYQKSTATKSQKGQTLAFKNPFRKEPIPKPTPKKKTPADLLARGHFPSDPEFGWIELFDKELLPWRELLIQTLQLMGDFSLVPKYAVPELNWFITHLKQLKLPIDTHEIFKTDRRITFKDYQAVRDKKNAKINNETHTLKVRFNFITRFLSFILDEKYTETTKSGDKFYQDGYGNPFIEETHISNPKNKVIFSRKSIIDPDIHNSNFRLPKDPEFNWLNLANNDLEPWKPLLTRALSLIQNKDGQKADLGIYLSEINRLLVGLDHLGLPKHPQDFFICGKSLNIDDWHAYRKDPQKGNKKTQAHSKKDISAYQALITVLDHVMSNNFSYRHRSGFLVANKGYANPFKNVWRKDVSSDPKFEHFDLHNPQFGPWKICLSTFLASLRLGKTRRLTLTSIINTFFIDFLKENLISPSPATLLGGHYLDETYWAFLQKKNLSEEYSLSSNDVIYDLMDFAVRYFQNEKGYENKNLINPIQKRKRKKKTNESFNFDHLVKQEPALKQWATTLEEYLTYLDNATTSNRGQLTHFLTHLKEQKFFSITNYLGLTVDEKLTTYIDSRDMELKGKKKLVFQIYRCIEWIRNDLSDEDGFQIGKNPTKKLYQQYGHIKVEDRPSESTKALMPRYIVDHLTNLAFPEGSKSFSDLSWMHENLSCWYEVAENVIDPSDPDCVWKKEEKTSPVKRTAYYMWNPCFSVWFLLLSNTALRGFQIQVLDSGESDTYRYEKVGHKGSFRTNDGPLAPSPGSSLVRKGVFYLPNPNDSDMDCQSLFINTNKTGDTGKQENAKGYVTPLLKPHEILFWLTKLRNWQEKFNPAFELLHWQDIPPAVIGHRNKRVMAKKAPASFLFRDPSANGKRRLAPLSRGQISTQLRKLMVAAELTFAERGITRDDGAPITLVKPKEHPKQEPNLVYTAHAFRVGMISYLVLDAGIPIEVVSKMIAGHASVIMTLYYTKVSQRVMREVLDAAETRSIETKKLNAQRDLENKPYEELTGVFAGLDTLQTIKIAKDNPASGYLFTDIGICPVSASLCESGGEAMNPENKGNKQYKPVPGFPKKNCVRCRFNLTSVAFLPGLFARANEAMWHVGDQQQKLADAEYDVRELEDLEHANAIQDLPFSDGLRLKRARERLEQISLSIAESLKDMQAAHHLIKTSLELERKATDQVSLVGIGDIQEIEIGFTETYSEIYSTAVLCQNAEIYKTIDASKASIRQGQLLDIMLRKNGLQPVFFELTEQQQLLAGNALMRLLQTHTPNKTIGETLEFTDGYRKLSEIGILPAELQLTIESSVAKSQTHKILDMNNPQTHGNAHDNEQQALNIACVEHHQTSKFG